MLVLSLFPGIGLLDRAFEAEGFCVVRGPDVLWGGDIRNFYPPAGRFDGVIGGPPCQAFSLLAHMVRHNGREPRFGNLIPEFERCVQEARPAWFLMEEVPQAPVPSVRDYRTQTFLLNNRSCADESGQPAKQNRARAWTWGRRGSWAPLRLELQPLESIDWQRAALGGSARQDEEYSRPHRRGLPWNAKSRAALAENILKQGLPADFTLPGFTIEAACKAVGNGVPLPMGRAIARAVRQALGLPLVSEATA